MNSKEYEGTLRLLEELKISINKKEQELLELKNQERDLQTKTRRHGPRSTGVHDRDGTPICIGDEVIFLTKGLHTSKRGVVYKVSSNKSRVTSRDNKDKSISRAPHNLRVVSFKDVE